MLLGLAVLAGPTASAQNASIGGKGAVAAAKQTPSEIDRGWFYFEEPPAEEEIEPEQPQAQPKPQAAKPPPKESKEERCSKKGTWTADCGFVNPGTDFEFQAKQRDVLMERMSVSNNDPKAVEDFQYYMHWVLERTSQVTNLWWYNMAQNPELDPTAAQPISAMGLRLMTDVRKGAAKEVFDLVKDEGGMFVYFSRSDCVFCHQMSEPLRMLQDETGVPIRNASLDEKCMPKFAEGCLTGELATQAAQALQVGTVPSVFLYVKPNTWIRIATGITDTDSMVNRSMQFFSAYRSALLKGIDNGHDGRPSVSFDTAGPTGNVSTGLGGSGPRVAPEQVISDMLGAAN